MKYHIFELWRKMWRHGWSWRLYTQLKQLWNFKSLKKIQTSKKFEPRSALNIFQALISRYICDDQLCSHFCYCKFKARFLKTSYFCIWERIFWDGFVNLSWNFQDFAVLSKFCDKSIKPFPSSSFCRSYTLNIMLKFLYQIWLVTISILVTFFKNFNVLNSKLFVFF